MKVRLDTWALALLTACSITAANASVGAADKTTLTSHAVRVLEIGPFDLALPGEVRYSGGALVGGAFGALAFIARRRRAR